MSPSPALANQTFDYIVVGAGSAGCVVAAQLARAGRVLLLEAGDAAEKHPETLSADGFKDAFAKDAVIRHRMSTAQAGCGGRRLFAGSGWVVGGSGAVNGMVYTRGDRADFESWPAGWQWPDLEPAFAAIEARLKPRPHPGTAFAERCLTAATQAGHRRQDGLNDGQLDGAFGYNDCNTGDEERRHAWRAFIQEQPHDNLRLLPNAAVRRLLIEDGRAVGVEATIEGRLQSFEARHEIILCAGALETPRLLMLSGIGPAGHLAELGIPLKLDAPQVGENLQDHPNVCLFYRSRAAVDFAYPQVYGFARAGETTEPGAPDSCYVFYAAPASLRQSMLRMLPVLMLPGRLHGITALRRLIRGLINAAFRLPPLQRWVGRLFGIVVILGKPRSRGRIRLASADPAAPAEIDLGYYRDPQDRASLLAAIAKAKKIAAQPAFTEVGITPLSAGARSDDPGRIWRWAQQATMTTFHYCGSVRMGEDAASPVDPQLRLRGMAGLRIADASVMPEIPVSALNAPSMLIGHRAAEFILAEQSADAAAPAQYGT